MQAINLNRNHEQLATLPENTIVELDGVKFTLESISLITGEILFYLNSERYYVRCKKNGHAAMTRAELQAMIQDGNYRFDEQHDPEDSALW